jgi:hypothetical protein
MDMHDFGDGKQLTCPVCETRDIRFVGVCYPTPGRGVRRGVEIDCDGRAVRVPAEKGLSDGLFVDLRFECRNLHYFVYALFDAGGSFVDRYIPGPEDEATAQQPRG